MDNGKDHFTLWVISGIIGVVVRDLYDLAMVLFAHSKNAIWNIASDIFVSTPQVHTFLGVILGLLADMVVGGLLGILVGFTIKLTGPKNYWLKGLGIGQVAWLFFFGILLHNLPHIEKTAPVVAGPNILSYIGHSIFGLVTAWTYVKLAKLKDWA